MEDYGILINKRLDQHFLLDKAALDKEVALAGLKKGDIVLEAGAGTGSLTRKLAEKCKVVAIEKDAQFIPLLKGIKNTDVIHADVMDVIKDVVFNKVVSNIPYSISQPLLLALLMRKWDIAVLVVQKEFALKMLAKSKLAVLVNDCCEYNIDSFIPGSSFYPPAVDSALVVMKQKKLMDEGFWKFLSVAYTQRNRDVRNVFKSFPTKLERKKIHQLSAEELKALHEINDK